jgi:hypothetical protein
MYCREEHATASGVARVDYRRSVLLPFLPRGSAAS